MPQRFEGHNLEEALSSAASAFGVERSQIRYNVVLEKRGFLGGVKRVVIEADENPDAPRTAAPTVTEATPAPSAPATPAITPAPPRKEEKGGRGQRARGESQRGERAGRGDGRRERADAAPLDLPAQGEESDDARAAHEWCEEVLSLAHIDVVLRTEETESQIVVRMYGADSRRLTDRHGELLDALQVLVNKAMAAHGIEKDIELDSESFKERRVENLERQAREAADRVRREHREQLLPVMSPIERRIVHLALRDDADVTTESRGEGFFKRVAIVLRPASADDPGETPAPNPDNHE